MDKQSSRLYSCRSARIGSILAARRAGKREGQHGHGHDNGSFAELTKPVAQVVPGGLKPLDGVRVGVHCASWDFCPSVTLMKLAQISVR